MTAALFTLIFHLFFLFDHIFKKRHIRTWLSGQPTVIIEKGKILDMNMKKI